MEWTIADVAAATKGRRVTGDPEAELGRVGLDSRLLGAGDLFVAIVAERDGHEYLRAAADAGAAAVLVEAGRAAAIPDGVGAVEVADTRAALLDLGRAARRRLQAPVIGITGSVGKTSTKDLLAAALSQKWRTAASDKSFNNELGVPLTLANAAEDTEAMVVEMGARGVGHIAALCEVARPGIGVVTAVAAVHTELFGSLEAVAQAKGELVEAIGERGAVVLNADDLAVAGMRRRARPSVDVLRYSAAGALDAEVVATDVVIDDDLHPSFVLHSPWGKGPVRLGVRGLHQVGNALAAATVALRCQVSLDEVTEALATAAISSWRMALGRAASGATILNDAYNANPTSMEAALRALARLPAERRVAVVGEMAELGSFAPESHRRMASIADELGIDLIVVGTPLYGRPVVAGVDQAVEMLESGGPLGPGDAVLVKASRVAGLERLAARLLDAASPAGCDS
jgi:UDP-N-acetylmuramoyl-tripeptide--D-alanyl-D-alanine ligase